ncbi:MAG: hypothetical protein WC100_01410 [Sterolibacterium sp.]
MEYYEINVSLRGGHFFATAPRSITHEGRMKELRTVLAAKFPAAEGYELTVTKYETRGITIKEEAPANPIPTVVPHPIGGSHKTGSLSPSFTKDDITRILGFAPNVQDDPAKVTASWGFMVNGHQCGIWDYKGGRWSTYGPQGVFDMLFVA